MRIQKINIFRKFSMNRQDCRQQYICISDRSIIDLWCFKNAINKNKWEWVVCPLMKWIKCVDPFPWVGGANLAIRALLECRHTYKSYKMYLLFQTHPVLIMFRGNKVVVFILIIPYKRSISYFLTVYVT